jgi:hypothetical protein
MCRSVNNVVISAAMTGNDSRGSRAVLLRLIQNKGIRSGCMFLCFILIVIEIKLTDPRMEDTPGGVMRK